MTFAANSEQLPDTPEARRYNHLRRVLSVIDFLLGLAFLLVLLFVVTPRGARWSEVLRDWAWTGARQHYVLAVFVYVAMLLFIGKLLGLPLDLYSFRLEHRYNLSNQKLRSWAWDEIKGWLVGLVLATIVAELIYWAIRAAPERWWLIAWAVFIALSIFFAQIAPVVL